MKDEQFNESLRLLRDLADIQNGPPLVQDEEEWSQIMSDIYMLLNKIDLQKVCPHCHRFFETPETFGSVFCCKACDNGY